MDSDGLWKTRYLTQVLSHRTRGKDFENYVIHAIWNRVADLDIKPVAQQLVRLNSGRYALLDMYFPQVQIAIECDELHHKNQTEPDSERAVGIVDALRSIDQVELSEDIIRVKLADFEGKPHGDTLLDREITRIADTVRRHADEKRANGELKEWTENRPNPFAYFKDRDRIVLEETIVDNVGFRTIAEVHQSLFNSTYRGWRSYFHLDRYHPDYEGYTMSFGSTNLDFGSGRLGWTNTLSSDGKTLHESNTFSDPGDHEAKHDDLRVWFLRDRSRVAAPDGSANLYRFAGVFEHEPGPDPEKTWRRITDELPLHATIDAFRP